MAPAGGSSAKQNVYLPGWPNEDASESPGVEPSTFSATSRIARPIVAFGRFPGPNTPWRAFMPISCGDRTAHDRAQRGAARAGQHRVQVELRVEHRLQSRHHDREVRREASRHDRVDRSLLERDASPARGEIPDQQLRVLVAEDREHLLHPLGRRRDHRQPVGPAAGKELLLDLGLLELERLVRCDLRQLAQPLTI